MTSSSMRLPEKYIKYMNIFSKDKEDKEMEMVSMNIDLIMI